MKTNIQYLLFVLMVSTYQIQGQETQNLSIADAVHLALENGDAAKITESQISTATYKVKSTKSEAYPDVKLSGQYAYLTNADVNLKLATSSEEGSSSGASPDINQLLLGQANVSMPLFSGYKLKNAIAASKNALEATNANATTQKNGIALKTITDYISLYKAEKTVEMVEDNLKRASQRVVDFAAMEANGILAKNDLLKAQLQRSNVQLTLEEARKNRKILNYTLVTTLKLPSNSTITVNEDSFGALPQTVLNDSINRSDLQAIAYQEKAAENEIKIAKSDYYPTIAATGGYIALDLQNALTVKNAMNIGVGISYNLANIFKSGSKLKMAKSKAEELQHTYDQYKDDIKIEVENAKEEYQLALKKLEVYLKSEEQASENYRIVKDKYDNGLVDTNDLLEADVDQLQSKINLAYARADIALEYYQLLQTEGILINQFTNN